jgi:hypothetical protein
MCQSAQLRNGNSDQFGHFSRYNCTYQTFSIFRTFMVSNISASPEILSPEGIFRMSKDELDRGALRRFAEPQPNLTVELSLKLTSEQITLWRQAASRASWRPASQRSAKAFFRSLRASGTRFTVRELGRSEKLTSQQADRRHSGFNGPAAERYPSDVPLRASS